MGLGDEFKRNPSVFTVFFFAGGMLLMVNQLEGSYARTLIRCDTPISTKEGELFSGSAYCGDRNLVINEGARLSATAQALELFAKFVMMTAAAVLSDMYGRRPVLLVGLSCITASVFLFFVGSIVPSISFTCFYLGQCLQGAHAGEIIALQIFTDLCYRADTDTQSVQALGQAQDALNKLLFAILIFVLQSMELTSYTNIWFTALLVNGSVLALSFAHFPETLASKTEASGSFLSQVLGQLKEYKTMLGTTGLPVLVMSFVFKSMSDGVMSVLQPVSLAFYGMRMDQFYMYFFPLLVIAAACGGVVVGMTAKLGERKAFWYCNYYQFACNLLFLGVPFNWFFAFGTYWAFMITVPGYEALQGAMTTKFLAGWMSKYIAMRQLCTYCVQIVTNPLYAYSFDATSVSYFDMNKPYLICLAFRALELLCFFAPGWGCYKFMETTFDALAEERRQKAAEGDTTKPSDEKKEE